MSDEPPNPIDLETPDRASVGVTRGEQDIEIGRPREYPDRADVSLRANSDADRLVLTIDVLAGDHGTGHADVELTPAEARALADTLEETVRSIE